MATLKITNQVRIEGSQITLDDLRTLVTQTSEFAGSAKVVVSYSDSQREGNWQSITVEG